ncbi:MAG: hypothetical protein BWZ02_01894 [Lentisphaerae bacterium ADurb.BinA184]|nr:MAG: hypothetical protein BWZ02_01894 [Lentisphaerae bacterium ADurb.BinA184]
MRKNGLTAVVCGLALAAVCGLSLSRAACLPGEEVVIRVGIPFRAGGIVRLILTEKPVEWVELDEALLAGKLLAEEAVASAQVLRAPDEGSVFLIAMVELGPGHSLGRYDYSLEVGTAVSECLAIAPREGAFDPRRHEVLDDSSGTEVRMLFQLPCPTHSTDAALRPNLKRTLREGPVELTLALPEPAQPENAPPPAEETGQAVPAPEGEAATEPAAKPEGEPEAKPEAAPAEVPAAKPDPEPAKPAPKPAPEASPKPADPKPAEPAPAKPAPKPEKPAPAKPVEGGSLWD